MKRNEIRFIATESSINCEGNITLSEADRKKVEQMLDKVENAAKNLGVSISFSQGNIQLGFNVAAVCDAKYINNAEVHMKEIIEKIRDFITNLEISHEQSPEEDANEEAIAKRQSEEIRKFFDEMHEKYPNANLAFVCEDGVWTSVSSNMSPTRVLSCVVGARIAANRYGENQ